MAAASQILPKTTATGAVDKAHNAYMQHFEESESSLSKRIEEYAWVTNTFYDLVTDIYEYGWGDSFHFAPRGLDETFIESLRRHEYYLALQLGLKPGMTCLDLGAGVGGPLKAIGRFSGANVTGVNNNSYQIAKANVRLAKANLISTCKMLKADFMQLPYEDNSIDAAYQIEATCHTPDRVGCYKSIFRVLKPGSLFNGYEWCLTSLFDPTNAKHREIRKNIEVGNGIPPMITTQECIENLKEAGFEIVDQRDIALDPRLPVPWYEPLASSYSVSGFRYTAWGRWLTHQMLTAAQAARLVPKGTKETSALLMMTAEALVEGGQKGIFTPSFYFLARKPEKKETKKTPPQKAQE